MQSNSRHNSQIIAVICLVLFSHVLCAEEDRCFVEGELQDFSTNHPRCLFYTGTEYYRNHEYLKASIQWEKLITTKDIAKEYTELYISAHNNLGYLYYHGLGVKQNTKTSLVFWHKAVSLGHQESEYHLCYTYGDPESQAYAPHNALMHCRKAENLYQGKAAKDASDKTKLETIENVIDRVENHLDP